MDDVRLLKIKAVASYFNFFNVSFAKAANWVLLAASVAVSFSADRRELEAWGTFLDWPLSYCAIDMSTATMKKALATETIALK